MALACNRRGCEGCTGGPCLNATSPKRDQYEECWTPVGECPPGCYPGAVGCKLAAPVPRDEPGAASDDHANNRLIADDITANARRDAYGTPDENHRRTATMWSAYLHARGNPRALSPEDVCFLNILQKISRDIHSPQPDNLVDAHGYLNNIEEIRRTSG